MNLRVKFNDHGFTNLLHLFPFIILGVNSDHGKYMWINFILGHDMSTFARRRRHFVSSHGSWNSAASIHKGFTMTWPYPLEALVRWRRCLEAAAMRYSQGLMVQIIAAKVSKQRHHSFPGVEKVLSETINHCKYCIWYVGCIDSTIMADEL